MDGWNVNLLDVKLNCEIVIMTTTTTTTSSDIFQRLHPRVYLERFLAEHVRPDGRPFNVARDVAVNVGVSATSACFYATPYTFLNPKITGSISTADGSALVRLGNTTVVCGVKAEIAEPELDAGLQGFLGVFLRFPPPPFLPAPLTQL